MTDREWTPIVGLATLLLLALIALAGVARALPAVTIGAALLAVVSRVRGLVVRDLVVVPPEGWHAAQFVNRVVFWSLAGWALRLSVSKLLGPAYGPAKLVIGTALAVLLLSSIVPRRSLHRSPNAVLALGSLFLLVQIARVVVGAPASAIVLDPPLDDTWLVANGGRSALVNPHWRAADQRHALDLTYAHPRAIATELALEDHPCWERVVRAPAAGRIVDIEEGLPDLAIGTRDESRPRGNHVVIDLGEGRTVLLAHLRQDSVPVAVGDDVAAGQIVGRCGNSGNTSEPHLHLQVNAGRDATPVVFRDVEVRRLGRTFRSDRADLRRNDEVRPVRPRR